MLSKKKIASCCEVNPSLPVDEHRNITPTFSSLESQRANFAFRIADQDDLVRYFGSPQWVASESTSCFAKSENSPILLGNMFLLRTSPREGN